MFRYPLVSIAALLVATPALAQTAGDRIVVTASRSGEGVAADETGASITVLDSETLEQRQTRFVADVLRDVPGIAVNRAGSVGGLTQIRIRGSESNHVLMLIDGIEVSDPYQGEYDLSTLIADPAARIEVLRGQQSSLYGSDAIGGVINYITLSGREAPGYRARIEGGSFGTISGAARAAGATDRVDYALSASYYGTSGYPTARGGSRDVGSDSVGASAKLNWTPSEALTLTGVLRYSYTDADTNNTALSGPTFGYLVDSPGVHSRNAALYGLLSAQFTAMDGRWVSTLSGQFADTTRKSFTPAGLDYGDKGRRLKGSFTSSLSLGSDAITHRLTGAVDVERETYQNITPSSFAFQGKRHTDNIGFVGQYEMLAGALSLGASVRHDENDRFADTTTWRVQGSYRLPTGTRLHAAYGTGVKNPGYFELYGYSDGRYIGNPNLKPEKSKGWEAGVEQRFGADGWATIGATWFDAKLTDEIFTDYPAPDYVATPANRMTDSKQHGIEAYANARPIPQIRFDLAYTWLKSTENGAREVRRPRHMGSVNATIFSADQRFSGTLTLRYNGAMTDAAYIDPSYIPVTVTLKDYALVNLSADYRLTDGLALFGRVENLLGTDYEEIFSYRGAGRAAYGGVRVAF